MDTEQTTTPRPAHETKPGAETTYHRGATRSPHEETANALTHGLGMLMSIVGLVLLVVFAALRGTAWHVVGCSVYGATLVLLFNCSMLYHLPWRSSAKRVFRLLDHASIFLLIAGTYTPFVLVTLRGPWGWTLFGLVWGLAAAGIVCESLCTRRLRLVAVPIYIAMGWLVLIALKPLVSSLPAGGVAWLVAGGVLYTSGVGFYAMKTVPYAHSIWHLFVLGGSVCHWISVMFYVIPHP